MSFPLLGGKMKIQHQLFLLCFLILIVFCILISKKIIEHYAIANKIKNILISQGKITSYNDFLFYLRERMPYGTFAWDLSGLYDEEDSAELRELKNHFIDKVKGFRKMGLYALIPFVCMYVVDVMDMICVGIG